MNSTLKNTDTDRDRQWDGAMGKKPVYTYGPAIDTRNLARVLAVILIGDRFYTGVNHQYAVFEYDKEYYLGKSNKQITAENMDENPDLVDYAAEITDEAFRDREMVGLDVWSGRDGKYLLSHYPQAFKDEKVLGLCMKYAEENDCRIGTFVSEDYLSDEARLLVFH